MKPKKRDIDNFLAMLREGLLTCDDWKWEATRPAMEAETHPWIKLQPDTITTVRVELTHLTKKPKAKRRRASA